jgi:hypothetical protein
MRSYQEESKHQTIRRRVDATDKEERGSDVAGPSIDIEQARTSCSTVRPEWQTSPALENKQEQKIE